MVGGGVLIKYTKYVSCGFANLWFLTININILERGTGSE